MATRDITLDVTIRAKTEDAAKASRALSDVEKEAAKAGSSMKGMSQESSLLDAQLAKSKGRLKELEQALAEVGDDKKLRQAIRSERSWIAELEKSAKDLAPVAQQAGKGFFELFTGGFKGAVPGLMPVVIGAVAGVAPLLGAAIGAAVVGVAGVGGVAGGIFAASKDPQVRMAASDLGKHISEGFFGSGSSFVEPIKASVVTLEKDFDQLNLGKTFSLAAPFVTEFADGLGGIGTEFMPRFNQVLRDGKPAIDLFAQDLPLLGTALGDLGVKLADSKGGLDGVNALFTATTGLIEGTGSVLAWLSDRYHDFNVTISKVSGFLAKVDSALGDNQGAAAASDDADAFARMSQGAQQGAIHFNTLSGAEKYNAAMALKLGDATADLTRQIKGLDDATRHLFGMEMSVDQANLAVSQGFLDLQKNLIKGKQNWSDNTQAGLDNKKMLLDQVRAIQQQRDAAVDAAQGNKAAIDKANAAYEARLQQIIAIGRAAGASQAQLSALAGEYDINLVVNTVQKGLQVAAGVFANALAAVGVKHRAGGGPVAAGQPYVVGEKQPELFVPSSNGYIMPRVPTGGGGGGTPVVISFAATGDSLLDAILKQLRKYIHVQGGDVQFALTG